VTFPFHPEYKDILFFFKVPRTYQLVIGLITLVKVSPTVNTCLFSLCGWLFFPNVSGHSSKSPHWLVTTCDKLLLPHTLPWQLTSFIHNTYHHCFLTYCLNSHCIPIVQQRNYYLQFMNIFCIHKIMYNCSIERLSSLCKKKVVYISIYIYHIDSAYI
jgi:hypothetical protein